MYNWIRVIFLHAFVPFILMYQSSSAAMAVISVKASAGSEVEGLQWLERNSSNIAVLPSSRAINNLLVNSVA